MIKIERNRRIKSV